jgi:4a-hydroxytetrahydrobiopterin dehydratase
VDDRPALDPTTLASQRCSEVDGSTPALDPEEAKRLAGGVDPAWQLSEGTLHRAYAFPTFAAAFGLATRIALLSESQGHHPTLQVGWGRLSVTWTTDSIGGLSANDFIMAAKLDRLVDRGLGIKPA